MNTKLIFVALLLTIAAAQVEVPEGSIKNCIADIRDAIPLAQQIKADFDNRNITSLINDSVEVFQLYEKVSVDCQFKKEEVQKSFVKCVEDIRKLIPVIKQTKDDFDAKNITALIDDGVAIYELVNLINEDCTSEAEEAFEVEFRSLAQTEETEEVEEDEEIDFPKPVRCIKHALNFTSELKGFIRDERNHSLTPEQTFNEIFSLLNDLPVVFTDCGLPVPSIFNNTKALQNCTVALYDLYEDIVKIDNDWNNKDINRIFEDLSGIFTAVNQIKEFCHVNKDEFSLKEQEVGGFAECIESVETLVADVQKFEADDIAHSKDVPLLVADVEAIWFALEGTLNSCGEAEITKIIEEYVSDECVEDVAALVDKAYDIYEEKDDALKHWRKFADDVIEFVHDLQKVEDQCGKHNTTMTDLEFSFEDYQFNITDCLKQSETVARDLDTLLSDIKEYEQKGFNPAEVEAITKDSFTLLNNILYDFVPACAGSAAEDDIIKYLPEECLTAIENATLVVEDIAEHDKDIKYILTSLPQLYESLVAIGTNCENTIGLFMKQYYTAADAIKSRVITN